MPKPSPWEFRGDVVRVAQSREGGVALEQIATAKSAQWATDHSQTFSKVSLVELFTVDKRGALRGATRKSSQEALTTKPFELRIQRVLVTIAQRSILECSAPISPIDWLFAVPHFGLQLAFDNLARPRHRQVC